MGLLDEIRRRQTGTGEVAVIDETGTPLLRLPADFMSGEVEILRGDLSHILHEATKSTTEYVFGDWITSLDETDTAIHVTFAHGEPRTFDLVVGADGLHSGVRALAFGEESTFRTDRGYYIAGTRRMNTPAITTLVNGLLDVGHREVEDRERCRCVVGLGVDQHVPTTAGAGQ
jgi:2-polyprenyl-6-methoxyphenol hydroxylase-like FAD-dependent oxidoreductase